MYIRATDEGERRMRMEGGAREGTPVVVEDMNARNWGITKAINTIALLYSSTGRECECVVLREGNNDHETYFSMGES